jgi:ribosomal protein S18 acetylase RimI-like enzyme
VRSNQPTHGSIDLELSTTPAERDVQVLSDGFERFNRMIPVGADRTKIPIAVWMRRDGQVLGGACGDTHYGWLYLSLLWVDEALRGQGWGRRLVENFEAAVVERGCHGAWVDTYGFQAPSFYERLGYREFGRLEEFPPGSARLFAGSTCDRAVKSRPTRMSIGNYPSSPDGSCFVIKQPRCR